MKVKVYSTSWCPYCHALMDWLDRLDVKYTTVDAEKLLQDANSDVKSVPAISINNELILGFDRPAIIKQLTNAGLIKPVKHPKNQFLTKIRKKKQETGGTKK